MASNSKLSITLRNLAVKVAVVLVSAFVTFLIINFLCMGFTRGFVTTKTRLATLSPGYLPVYLINNYKQTVTFLIKNVNNFMMYKKYYISYFICTLIPTILYFVFLFKYKAQLTDWEPFKQPQSEFGNAHWATMAEMKKAKLFEKMGVMLGKYKDKYLIEYSFQHILLFAPTGSGKGVGFVIPNLLFWNESAIVHDIKLENYEITSGYRFSVLHQKVFLWNPADQKGRTHCYNPMDWVARDVGGLVDDVQKIAKFLLPKDDFWNSEARSLVTGLMLSLYVEGSEKKPTLGETLRMIRSEDLAYSLAVILDTLGGKIHPVGYMNLGAFLNKADKERSGVCSTASSALELWSNPFVDAATSKSHTNIGSYRTIPTTLFVGISPNNIERLRPLLQIFYQQCATLFTNKLPTKQEKYGVLMLLDEFPTLGDMQEIKVGIAYYRGYKVKLFLIVQDTEQLKDIYKDAGMNSFMSNSYYRITFAANNTGTAKMISDLLGETSIESEDAKKTKYINLSPGANDVTISKKKRALLMPQEVITLPRDEEIIVIESKPPVRCNKIKYYEDKTFIKRARMPVSYVPTQKPLIAETKKKDNK